MKKLIVLIIIVMFLLTIPVMACNDKDKDNQKGKDNNNGKNSDNNNKNNNNNKNSPNNNEINNNDNNYPSTSVVTKVKKSNTLSSPYMGFWNSDVIEGDYIPILYTWRDINDKRKRYTTDYFPLPGTYRSGVIITPARFAGSPIPDYFWTTDQGKRLLETINKAS